MTRETSAADDVSRLRRDLAALEEMLAGATPAAKLRRLADPVRLDFLFRVQLSAFVRGGPSSGAPVPARLLEVAQEAAAAGALPLATPADLRRRLRRLADRMAAAGAWDPDRPPWWAPLGEPSAGEALWRRLRRPADALPPPHRLAEAFTGAEPPRWLALPQVLPTELIRTLYRELEESHRTLGLERAGVGALDQITSSRSDSVLYATGLEPELLAAAPTAAAIVQWCLSRFGPGLSKGLPGRPAFPPTRVMLARYPAPSEGYRPHLDNPGGAGDNGRSFTVVLYLNPPGEACAGGEITVWAPNASIRDAPAAVLRPAGGSGVLFDAHSVAHQVKPLSAGPARWALTLWLADTPRRPAAPEVPAPTLTEVLLPIAAPPLPAGKVLFHELDDSGPCGEIVVRRTGAGRPRVGIVCTVYRGGAALEAWCEHHLALGVDHLALVFDHLEEAAEAAGAERLRERWGDGRLTVWSGSELASERWPALPVKRRAVLGRYALSGSSSYAVAARQTLNASVALRAARAGELGGRTLDWLLHLDADELFYLEGDGRGGATLERHFQAAADAGVGQIRYLNHELLLPGRPGRQPRFKVNPRLAVARLGPAGWAQVRSHLEMAQTDPRPYFTGYFNGKSAVAVAEGASAAGVHGWTLAGSSSAAGRFLAGPSVLHFHFASAEAFRRKYLAAAASSLPPGPALFEPSPVEVATLERIGRLRRDGAGEATLERQLDRLHAEMTTFTEAETELLEEAGLIFEPELGPGALSLSLGFR